MRRVAAVAFVALLMILLPLDVGIPTVSAQSDSGSLTGQVCTQEEYGYDSGPDGSGCYGNGLGDAEVTLRRPGSLPAGLDAYEEAQTSGSHGDFYFGDLEHGTYQITIERAGFDSHESSIEVDGHEKRGFSLQGQQVTVNGKVEDQGGSAVSGASVRIEYPGSASATSDASGAFSVQVRAGYHSITISHADFYTLRDYVLLDGEGTQTFVLQPAPERTATVEGTVVDQDGAPVSGAIVEVYQYQDCCYYDDVAYAEEGGSSSNGAADRDVAGSSYPYHGDGYQSTQTADDGSYSIKVYAGWVDLNVWKDGHARFHKGFEIQDGEAKQVDVELLKFPEKTAHITGRVVDASSGDGLRWVSISVQSPEYGLYECSSRDGQADGGGSDAPQAMPVSGSTTISPGPDYYEGCAITVDDDGRFEGLVTPGYSIVRVYYEHYNSCQETRHADGSFTRDCGQDYYGWTRTLDLAPDSTTDVQVRLTPRPGPDAVLSGYVVDGDSEAAIAQAQISFSNQDSYGWASAQTDGDGSYKVRVRSGYHQVSVWAEGYLPWEGVVQVRADSETPFDIVLTPGNSSYGGCCWYYGAEAMDGDAQVRSEAAGAPSGAGMAQDESSSGATADFEDLGGGLGPYNAAERARLLANESEGAPAVGIVLIGLAMLVGVALRRRH